MNIAPDNLIYHELIGLDARIVGSSNPALAGFAGRVTDETRNMLIFGDKKVPKACAEFIFTLPSGTRVKVEGRLLLSQPENRVQMKFKSSTKKLNRR